MGLPHGCAAPEFERQTLSHRHTQRRIVSLPVSKHCKLQHTFTSVAVFLPYFISYCCALQFLPLPANCGPPETAGPGAAAPLAPSPSLMRHCLRPLRTRPPYSLTVSPPASPPHEPQSGLPHGYGSWGALKIPQRVRAEPGRQTHFGALQFKISAFSVATHSLFGSKSPIRHSIFGGDEVIGIPISANLGKSLPVRKGVSSTFLLAVQNWSRIHKEKDLTQ